MLKCFGRLGYFPSLRTVPAAVVEHVRREAGLPEGNVDTLLGLLGSVGL